MMKLLLVLISYLCFISCNRSNNNTSNSNDTRIKRVYYSDGQLKEEYPLRIGNQDSSINGVAKLYYPGGQLKLEVNFLEGTKHGQEIGYYENGSLEHIGWNYKGLQDSVWIWYYKSDNPQKRDKEQIDYWSKGKQISHHLKYDKSGVIKTYMFYDPLGRAIYRIRYNENGGRVEEEGQQIPQVILVNDREQGKYLVGDSFKAKIYHILPPDMNVNVYARIKGLDDNWRSLSSKNFYTPRVYEIELTEKGEFIFEAKLVTRDTLENEEFIHYNKSYFLVN